jgi:hypothetical protein
VHFGKFEYDVPAFLRRLVNLADGDIVEAQELARIASGRVRDDTVPELAHDVDADCLA